MRSSLKNSTVPLTGADCFLRAFNDEIRRYNRSSHVSQLILRLGPGFDLDGFRSLVDRVTAAQPILHAPIVRPYGVHAPVYRIGVTNGRRSPRIEVHEVETPPDAATIPAVLRDRMNDRFDIRRGDLLRFDVLRYPGGDTDFAMSWLHMLFDGSGSEAFVRWMDECFRGERAPHELPAPLHAGWCPEGSWRDRGQRATAWQKQLQQFAAHPPRSLAGPRRRVSQALRYDVDTLTREESERAVATARQRAGFLTPMLFYLAVVIRAHDAVFRHRGVDPGSYVVPLPVNLRPKGAEKALFRTHVSLLWFQVLPEQVADFDGLLAALKTQRRDAIKEGRVDDGLYAMEFARYAPQRFYAYMARRGFGGELCSFFFAFTGEFLGGVHRFLNAEIVNAFHAPAVPASPGSCAAMSLFRDRLNITHVRQDGVFDADERAVFCDQLRRDLLHAPT